jgi:hypothetical protein
LHLIGLRHSALLWRTRPLEPWKVWFGAVSALRGIPGISAAALREPRGMH